MVRYAKERKKVKKVVTKDNERAANKRKAASKTSVSKGFYYSFFTVILVLCLIQIAISAVLNVSKVIAYKSKIVQIEKTRDAAMTLNEQLKDNIKNFSNVNGLEEIARNNLKMSSEDEVLVIINKPKEEDKEKEERKSLFR